MIEIAENMWYLHTQGHWICITTNGALNRRGECVMGRGIAREAKTIYPRLAKQLGEALEMSGNRCFMFDEYRLITFPVKHNWWEKADIALIKDSFEQLLAWVRWYGDGLFQPLPVYIGRPGCNNGRLDWHREVKPILEPICPDEIVIVHKKGDQENGSTQSHETRQR